MNMSHTDGLQASMASLLYLVRKGLHELATFRAISMLLPSASVRVCHADGSQQIMYLPSGKLAEVRAGATDAVALVLPERDCLFRHIHLPLAVAARDEKNAVALEVETSSPFGQEETVYGWSSTLDGQGGVLIDIVISSAGLVQRTLESTREGGAEPPEIWALPTVEEKRSRVVIMQGFGERTRVRRLKQRFTIFALQIMLLFALCMTLLAAPIWHKRQDVISAQAHHERLVREVGPVMATRDQLERLRALGEQVVPGFVAAPDLISVLDIFSALLPDGTWLSQFEYLNGLVRIVGFGDDASMLLQRLQEEPHFRNVRATSTITRDPRTGKESFILEMELINEH